MSVLRACALANDDSTSLAEADNAMCGLDQIPVHERARRTRELSLQSHRLSHPEPNMNSDFLDLLRSLRDVDVRALRLLAHKGLLYMDGHVTKGLALRRDNP